MPLTRAIIEPLSGSLRDYLFHVYSTILGISQTVTHFAHVASFVFGLA